MATCYSKLIIGDSLKFIGKVPRAYRTAVRNNLLAEHPTATGITVTAEAKPADENSREPYTLLTASGEVDTA